MLFIVPDASPGSGGGATPVEVLAVVDEPSGTIPGDVAVCTSDGQTWEILEDVLPTSSGYNDVAYSEELEVFCTYAPGASPLSHTSDDLGETWTAGSAMPIGSGSGICWCSDIGIFVAGAAAANSIQTSTDGLAWTAQTHSAVGSLIWQPVWGSGAGLCIMGGNNGQNFVSDTNIARSSNGTSWTNFQLGSGNQGISSMCWSEPLGLFLGVTGNHNSPGVFSRLAWRSEDAVTWNSDTIVAADVSWSKVIWSDRLQKFVAISGYSAGAGLSVNSQYSGVSSDGITWTTSSTALPVAGHWRVLAETGSVLIAMLSGGVDSDNAAVSTDGLTWSSVAIGGERTWSGLAPKANLGTR